MLSKNRRQELVKKFTGSGDIKGGAFAYWSTARAYSRAYAVSRGPIMDLVDQAGANQITIYCLPNGKVHSDAIRAWVSKNSVTTIKVKQLYDQTGNGKHVSQATTANMPNLLLSHQALGNADIPVMDMLASATQTLASGATGLSQTTGTFSCISRHSNINTGSFGGVIQANLLGVAHTEGTGSTGNHNLTLFGGSVPIVPCPNEIFCSHISVFNGASSFALVNGVQTATVNVGSSTLGSPFTIGKLNGGNPLSGNIAEIRFDASVWTAADCVAEYKNQFNFWFNRVPHEGFVASRCRDKRNQDVVTNKYFNARSAHIASETLTSIRVVFDNEFGSGTTTITQSIEYPAGTFTQLTWLGATSIAIRVSDGAISDYVTVSIPKGDTFWVRTFCNSTVGIRYNSWQNTFLGEATAVSATSISDLTMSGTITDTGEGYSIPPSGIIGVTSNKSVMITGDSIGVGANKVEDSSSSATGYDAKNGFMAESCGDVPFVNSSRSATVAQSNVRCKVLWGFGSHHHCQLGVNDFIISNRTSAQMLADVAIILNMTRPNQKIGKTTITPYTDSTDSWATTVNQTVHNSGMTTNINAANSALRGGTHGMTTLNYVIDVANLLETSSKWIASPSPPYTLDGIHPEAVGHNLVRDANIATPT